MSKPVVYIDGKEGTTGLQIYDRLAERQDIELLLISEEKRKDTAERKKLMNASDLVFLCLPDAAAVEAVGLVENPHTRIIDASTAHRTADGWVYGFPELSKEQREAIRSAKRTANPGCHATGFISIVYPLVKVGLLPEDAAVSCFSLTGYSGGGKAMRRRTGRTSSRRHRPMPLDRAISTCRKCGASADWKKRRFLSPLWTTIIRVWLQWFLSIWNICAACLHLAKCGSSLRTTMPDSRW